MKRLAANAFALLFCVSSAAVSQQFAAHIKADLPKWAKVEKDAGIKIN